MQVRSLKEYEYKTKCRCFFDVCEVVWQAPCWIDKALWVLWRSKVPCPRGKERAKDLYKLIVSKEGELPQGIAFAWKFQEMVCLVLK